jgi:hypothetical protein
MEQQSIEVAPPGGVWEAVWPALEHALTPGTVMGMLLTLALTHAVKQMAVYLDPRIAHSLESWRAFCTIASIMIGAMVGTSIWLADYGGALTIPICAFLSGTIWRLLLAIAPAKIADAFMTETDRSFR